MKKIFVLSFSLGILISTEAQNQDSLSKNEKIFSVQRPYYRPISIKSVFIPAFLIGYGSFAQTNDELRAFDKSVKEEIWTDPVHHPVTIDNYLQYVPGFSVFGLRAAGISGKNNLKDEIFLYLMSNMVMGAVVNPIKYATHVQRPDGFGRNAFPSGHTATAFVGAEFLNQEYKDRSAWYSVAGYTVATGVGILRIYNNRHWSRDVVAGAGIGMLSTKFTYWLYPKIKNALTEKRELRREGVYAMSHFTN